MSPDISLQGVEYRDTGGREIYDITYARGGEEATVTVTEIGDDAVASCEQLPDDTVHDGFVLEVLASTFVSEHSTGFGAVG